MKEMYNFNDISKKRNIILGIAHYLLLIVIQRVC